MSTQNQSIESTAEYFEGWAGAAEAPPGAKPAARPSTERRRYYALECNVTIGAIIFTLLAWLAVTWETGEILWRRASAGDIGGSIEQIVFIAIVQALIYGNFLYQFARLGYLRRRMTHRPGTREELETLYSGAAPALTVLVPSYKEEIGVVRKTLLSAALQDYPERRVVLLLDDPPNPQDPADRAALQAMRRLPGELQKMLDAAGEPMIRACEAFLNRSFRGYVSVGREAAKLARHYEKAATLVESIGARFPLADHGDAAFMNLVIKRAAAAHRERARQLVAPGAESSLDIPRVMREYHRLSSLFAVDFTSFERKRYANLSHEPNKAMNLNSYIRLLGANWREVQKADGLHVEPARDGKGTIKVPHADYLITLDADSLIRPEYALVLINEMLRPGNERLAVAQTPYNTIPNPPNLLERIAGATTDIQYLLHQGFTRFNATYWVGANALLRVAALQDIRTTVNERGFEVPVYIQDRTVIEDTESSIDLVAKGWRLFNYPERLAFSATPPDFGALLIQRRRWANGGVIIVPKLMRYLAAPRTGDGKVVEGFFRFHYLGSIAMVNIGLLILLGHSFEHSIDSYILPLTALPYFLLYARDLRYSGYKVNDLLRVYALNLVLIPVNLGGVLKSLQQAITGRRTPFGRTPKVTGRTGIPTRYLVAEYALLAFWIAGCLFDVASQRWASAIFVFANALMLAYAIRYFVVPREQQTPA